MRVGLLGALEVEAADRAVDLGGARLRALLTRLALDAGRPVSAGALVDAVWEDALPADAAHALQSLVSRLRRALGDPALVAQTPAGYRLAVEPDDVDALRFERLAREGGDALRAGEAERAAGLLRDALALWRGPALAGLAGDRRFALDAAARLDDLRLAATLDRVDADLALGAAAGDALATELDRLAADHPLDERVARRQLRALAAAGRQADALAAYERIRAALDAELGAVPGPELQAAHLAVLRGEAAAPAAVEEAAAPRGPARTNLRAPLTSFVGRAGELAAVGEALTAHRLVTLLGPGGAGKTRLAQEAAARRVEHVPDGVWLVELAPVREEAEVAPAILGAIGLRDAAVLERAAHMPPIDTLQRVVDVLADRRALLVLDNCEHLVETAARTAEELLGRCPHLRIVATSREPLGIGGEQLVEVPPLAWPPPHATPETALAHPAVELFADRAAAARPGFAVDAENVAAVIEICRRLDGQPLAIELAAARLRSLPPHELARRLDDRFRLLTGGSRTAMPRHRTLRAVVDWSWELLTEPERALARRLAVFAAGATPESAEAVCAGGGLDAADVLDTLAALVDRSLVQAVDPGAAPRYRMLETIREYGLERLEEAGETAATRDAHAEYFAALAIDAEPLLRTADQIPPFRLLTAERENVVAALRRLVDTGDAKTAVRLALALVWYTLLSGDPGEVLPLLRLALSAEGESDPDERTFAEVIVAVAATRDELAQGSGADDLADGAGERLRTLADRLATVDTARVPLALLLRATLVWVSGDRDQGGRLLALARSHRDPWVRAIVPLMRAQVAENDGDVATLRTAIAEALPGLRSLGDRWALTLALVVQSNVLMLDGDLDAAAAALDEARTNTDVLATRGWTMMLELRLAELRLRRGDAVGARADLTRLAQLHDLAPEEELIVLAMRARLACSVGADDEARGLRRQLERVLAGASPAEPGRGHGEAIARSAIAALLIEDGELDAGRAELAEAHASAVATRDMPIVAIVGLTAATLAEREGRPLDGAETLGATAAVRGSGDETNQEVVQLAARLRAALGEDAYAAAYARGLQAPRDAAVARLHPESTPLSDPAGVRP